jgi:hypothetical protein
MPPQPDAEAGPEATRDRRSARRMSGRAQRRAAQEQAEKRKRLTLFGSAIGVGLLVALIVFLVTRPQETGPPILAAESMSATIPVEGVTMGSADAPVTVVEWGDYT